MDFSTLFPLLFVAVIWVSNSIEKQAFTKLNPEQQRAAQAPNSILVWLPLFVTIGIVVWFEDKIESIATMYVLFAVSWAVPMLIIFAWQIHRLKAKELPSSYLKNRLISQAILLGGGLLILFWR